MTIRVEITPVVAPADEQTMQRLENLGQLTASDGVVNTQQTCGWVATVNGTAIPLAGFAVEPDDGRVLVSLVLEPDEVSVRRTPTEPPAPAAAPAEKARRGVWGDPNTPDPRAGMRERLGAQVARNAEATA